MVAVKPFYISEPLKVTFVCYLKPSLLNQDVWLMRFLISALYQGWVIFVFVFGVMILHLLLASFPAGSGADGVTCSSWSVKESIRQEQQKRMRTRGKQMIEKEVNGKTDSSHSELLKLITFRCVWGGRLQQWWLKKKLNCGNISYKYKQGRKGHGEASSFHQHPSLSQPDNRGFSCTAEWPFFFVIQEKGSKLC